MEHILYNNEIGKVSRGGAVVRAWIEFVVGSCPCSEGFSPGSPVFLPPQKPTFLNSNLIGNSRAMGLSVEDCCVSPSLKKKLINPLTPMPAVTGRDEPWPFFYF